MLSGLVICRSEMGGGIALPQRDGTLLAVIGGWRSWSESMRNELFCIPDLCVLYHFE